MSMISCTQLYVIEVIHNVVSLSLKVEVLIKGGVSYTGERYYDFSVSSQVNAHSLGYGEWEANKVSLSEPHKTTGGVQDENETEYLSPV